MAKKAKSVYMCAECGNEFPSWQGQCSYCGAWNSIVEQKVKPDADSDARRRTTSKATPSKLKSVGTGIIRGLHLVLVSSIGFSAAESCLAR